MFDAWPGCRLDVSLDPKGQRPGDKLQPGGPPPDVPFFTQQPAVLIAPRARHDLAVEMLKANSPVFVVPQVTIIIKGYLECIPGAYHSYTLLSGRPLASTLDNGVRQVGYARLRVRDPGRHVLLELRHVGTVLSIRLLPPKPDSKPDNSSVVGLLSIMARVPRQLVESQPGRRPLQPQLCSSGCPPDRRLDERRAMARSAASGRARTVALALAEEACRREGLRDSFLDACVFDAVLGRPPGSVQLAAGAMADLRRLSPGLASALNNRTQFRPYPVQGPQLASVSVPWARGDPQLLCLCAFLALAAAVR